MTLLEQAAQAVRERLEASSTYCEGDLREMLVDGRCVDLVDVVRTVLTAVREPTPLVIDAGINGGTCPHMDFDYEDQWRAQIDALLAETPR